VPEARVGDAGIDWNMSEFVRVLAVADLPPGRTVEVDVGGRSVAVFNVGGDFHALVNRCPHRGGPLGQGFVEGSQVSCPWHNWTFDVTTGENVASADITVEQHEVKVEDGYVYVKLAG
jgi:nitrite reductase (NADH) small subunit